MSLGLSFDLEELISDGMVIARKINLQKKNLDESWMLAAGVMIWRKTRIETLKYLKKECNLTQNVLFSKSNDSYYLNTKMQNRLLNIPQ